MMVQQETRKCLLEYCNVTFEVTYKGRPRLFCCHTHKKKHQRLVIKKKVADYDFVRFQKLKLVSLLTTPQKKKAREWGLLYE